MHADTAGDVALPDVLRPSTARRATWYCLMYCNSCVNPFIYNYASKDFRDGFREVVAQWRTTSSAGGTVQTSGQAAYRPLQQLSGQAAYPAADDALVTGEGHHQ